MSHQRKGRDPSEKLRTRSKQEAHPHHQQGGWGFRPPSSIPTSPQFHSLPFSATSTLLQLDSAWVWRTRQAPVPTGPWDTTSPQGWDSGLLLLVQGLNVLYWPQTLHCK